VKNAPAVTARRATNQIVLVAEHQALAATAVVILPAVIAAATLAIVVVVAIVLVVIVLAEQTVRVVTMRLIDHAVMAHRLIDHAVMAHRLIDLVAMVRPVRRARLAIVPIPRGLHAMEIVHTLLDPHVMEILGHHVRVATGPTRLVLLAMVRPVRVAMARTAHVSPAATANRAAGPHVAMVILQVGLRVPGETGPIRRAPRARDRVLIVHEVTVRIALVAIGLTVLAPIGHTAISRAASGSPMGESVVRSARR
jgi:hypothetical protein